MEISEPPFVEIEEDAIEITYFASIDDFANPNIYFLLELASDNTHIKKIYLVASKEIISEYHDQYVKYAASLGIVYMMAREESYFYSVDDPKNFDLLYAYKPAYNDTVIMEYIELDEYFVFTLSDIS